MKPLGLVVDVWILSGFSRRFSGYPAIVTVSDSNQLGDLTHTSRPDLVSGVPVVNS